MMLSEEVPSTIMVKKLNILPSDDHPPPSTSSTPTLVRIKLFNGPGSNSDKIKSNELNFLIGRIP
jgi:hypothetical protein